MSTKKVDPDWLTIFIYLLLVAIGFLAVYAADYNDLYPKIWDTTRNYGRQFVWVGICMFVALIIQVFDTRFFTAFSYLIYGAVLLLLVATLFFGAEIAGSKSWIKLGFFNLQSSEFAKFSTCLALASFLSNKKTDLNNYKHQLIAAALIGVPTLLILRQGDAGSAIVFVSLILVLYREGLSGGFLLIGVLAIVLFISSLLFDFPYIIGILGFILLMTIIMSQGLNFRSMLTYLIPIIGIFLGSIYLEPLTFLIVLGIAAILFLFAAVISKSYIVGLLTLTLFCSIYVKGVDYIFNNVLKEHHRNRIGVVLGTIEDNKGVGYNLNQSKIAIGSGGIWGKGFLQGTQNKGDFVPEQSTDFIFCTVGEEFGFAGSCTLIGLFIILMLRIIALAERQKSDFSRIYGYGVVSIIFFHFFINMGMTIGLVPVIGIPLPFISYGGSSLLAFTILLFILIKLDSERLLYLR